MKLTFALLDFEPLYCPACGGKIPWDRQKRIHYHRDKTSMHCRCGLRYQECDSVQIIEAARKAGGDLDGIHASTTLMK
jgi:hypothetical protein